MAMVKDEDVAHYPDITKESVTDMFGKRIFWRTIHEGKLYYVSRTIETVELANTMLPIPALIDHVEGEMAAELKAAVEAPRA